MRAQPEIGIRKDKDRIQSPIKKPALEQQDPGVHSTQDVPSTDNPSGSDAEGPPGEVHQMESGEGEEEEEEEEERGENVEEQSEKREKLLVKGEKPKARDFGNGRFEGLAEVLLPESVKQYLNIMFNLRIDPQTYSKYTDCTVTMDSVVVTASKMVNENDLDQDLPYHFITERICIIIGASGDYHSSPSSVYPGKRQFVEKIVEGSTIAGAAGLELSHLPKGTLKGSYSKSVARELPSSAAEVKELFNGPNRPGEHAWKYKPAEISTAARVELSLSRPPHHSAKFRMNIQDPLPTDIKVCVKGIFGARGKISRGKSTLPNRVRYRRDFKVRHMMMSMEARIGTFGGDVFDFPTEQKTSCKLSMNVDQTRSNALSSEPELRRDVAVYSILESSQ
jgi:hypothetical protein